jgi:hypothetical protein
MRTFLLTLGLMVVSGCGASPQVIPTLVGVMGGEINIAPSEYRDLAGTRIIIPMNALTENVIIEVATGPSLRTGREAEYGPSINIKPVGLEFQRPALLILPYRAKDVQPGIRLFVGATNDHGERIELADQEAEITDGSATINMSFFHGDYQVLGALTH